MLWALFQTWRQTNEAVSFGSSFAFHKKKAKKQARQMWQKKLALRKRASKRHEQCKQSVTNSTFGSKRND